MHGAAGRRGAWELGSLALPVEAPRSGLVAVLSIVWGPEPGPDAGEELAEVAAEVGLALGTANLYEQALAMREKSEAILARVADAVVVTDTRGVISDWNRAAQHIAGQTAAAAVGRSCAEVLGLRVGETGLDCSRGCALLALEADPFLGVEAWRPRGDGRRQPLLASVSGVTDADGTIVQIVHSLRDITKLKEADEAKTFLATASHELKTPLTVIKGFAETLLRVPGWDPAQREEGLSAIARRAGDLSRIVNRLLLSSRIEAGRVEVELTDVSLEPILEERVHALRAASGRDVELDVPEALPMVRADVDAFTTILDHLLDNAVKYSPDGGAVRVTAAPGTGVRDAQPPWSASASPTKVSGWTTSRRPAASRSSGRAKRGMPAGSAGRGSGSTSCNPWRERWVPTSPSRASPAGARRSPWPFPGPTRDGRRTAGARAPGGGGGALCHPGVHAADRDTGTG